MEQGNYTNWRNNTLNARMQTNKKYLILKMGDYLISTAGLGWYILYTLMGIRFGIENGFIPVVDWKNCKLPQYDAKKVGRENVWEYFFEQPLNISLEHAYDSGNYFVIDDVRKFNYTEFIDATSFKDFCNEKSAQWRQFFHLYIRLKKEVKEYFDRCASRQVGNDKKMIGILARGTDYKELKPIGHLKPICDDLIFHQIDIINDENYIFLATEDNDIFMRFQRRYPGRVYSVPSKRYKNLGHDTLNSIYTNENGYERDLNYLYALYVISQCEKCVYSACGGGILASLMRQDEGESYNFICHGYNRATGMIVGSFLEKQQGKMLFMGNKPIMFYALNTLRLLNVEEVYIIVTEIVKVEYQKLIGCGEKFGIRINYLVSDSYDAVRHMIQNPNFMKASKMLLLYTDYFVHGIGIAKELSEKICTFDGAYAWGSKVFFSDDVESMQVNAKNGIPQEAFIDYQAGNYSLMGRYIFDFELKEIIEGLLKKKNIPTIIDVLNEYIHRKKLFFLMYKRGTIYSRIYDINSMDKTGQVISLIEELQKEEIGNFEFFREGI